MCSEDQKPMAESTNLTEVSKITTHKEVSHEPQNQRVPYIHYIGYWIPDLGVFSAHFVPNPTQIGSLRQTPTLQKWGEKLKSDICPGIRVGLAVSQRQALDA